jgi:hypothetical protein
MNTANTEMRDILLLKKSFWNKPEFDDKLSKLEANLVTLAEETERAMPTVPGSGSQSALPFPGNNPAMQESQNRQTTLDSATQAASEMAQSFSYSKAVVISVVLVITGILAYKVIIPPVWFLGILGIAFTFLFFDQVKDLTAFFKTKEDAKEELSNSMRLDNWITESFQWIRERYTSAYMLVEIQTSSKTTLPDWALPDMTEGIYNRKIFFEKTLPTEFLTRIDRIIISCKKNVWARKQVLINAIAVTKSASAGAQSR